MLSDGDGRKTLKYTKTSKTKEKILRLIPLQSPLLRYGGRLFSGIREHRKQAGPILNVGGFII